jgi:hypothetical protein
MSNQCNYEVTLDVGGPLSGARLHGVYKPGETVFYGPEHGEYVENVLAVTGRFKIVRHPIKVTREQEAQEEQTQDAVNAQLRSDEFRAKPGRKPKEV